MLLELLQHHHGLFLAAIEPLIGARKVADLAALAASCRLLHGIINDLALYKHHNNFQKSLNEIKSINTLYNNCVTIRDYNDTLVIYHWRGSHTRAKKMVQYYIWNFKNNTYHSLTQYHVGVVRYFQHSFNSCATMHIKNQIPIWLLKYINNGKVHIVDKSETYFIFFDSRDTR